MSDEQLFERIKDALRGKVETFLEKVTPVYAQLNWQWNINGETRLPNEEDVMFKLYNLIDALQFNKRGYWTGSCGLKVQYQFKKEGIEVSMVFTKEIADRGVYNF
ncbi:MAG TPA: hypothetical protein VHO03_11090 [Ignavibacteriales bacterium]|nr:hypothetical protein [Ignavibacteriales bacterium]